MPNTTTPIDGTVQGLITTVDGVQRLVGARCTVCDTHTFPAQGTCPQCGSDMLAVALPRHGKVWSWTVQRIQPKPPFAGGAEFEPFAVGYVDLGPVRVESRLAGKAVDAWQIGDPLVLVVGAADADGSVWSYWFEGAAS
jgi:uncharacterized OB-fold protein